MATYIIGDVHGCFRTFEQLLSQIVFDNRRDRLWMVGDLVNGGPDSLAVLRWAFRHSSRVTTVLGNHDLYLLARALNIGKRKKRDTLEGVLRCQDRHDLIDWLRSQPVIFRQGNDILLHAGLHPEWRLETVFNLAREIEATLRGSGAARFLKELFRKRQDRWDPSARDEVRLSTALQFLTTLRTCRKDGRVCRRFTGPPEEAPRGCSPWYSLRPADEEHVCFFFGHWAALGFRALDGAVALDSGCVWGGSLTVYRLEDERVFQVPSREGDPSKWGTAGRDGLPSGT